MSRKIRQPGSGREKPPLTKLKELPVTERYILMHILRGKSYVEAALRVSELAGFFCGFLAIFADFCVRQREKGNRVNAGLQTWAAWGRIQAGRGWSPLVEEKNWGRGEG